MVEGIVSLILELVEYEDLRTVLSTLQLHETLLKEVLEKFAEREEIATPAQAAIDKLTDEWKEEEEEEVVEWNAVGGGGGEG